MVFNFSAFGSQGGQRSDYGGPEKTLGSPRATACWFLEPLLGEFEAAFRVSSSGDYSGNEVSMEIVFFVVMGGYAVHPNGFYGHPVTLTPRGFVILYEKEFIKDEELDPLALPTKPKRTDSLNWSYVSKHM